MSDALPFDVERRLSRSKGGLRMVPYDDNSTSLLDIAEPEWQEDTTISACSSCKGAFSFMNRRHHCRMCGLVLCATCSPNYLPVRRMGYSDPVRVCAKCEAVVRRDNTLMDVHCKTLCRGLRLQLAVADDGPDAPPVAVVFRLSRDHRSATVKPAHERVQLPGLPLDLTVTNYRDVRGAKGPRADSLAITLVPSDPATHRPVVLQGDTKTATAFHTAMKELVLIAAKTK